MKKYMRLIFFVTLMCIISFPTEETTKNIEVFSRTVKEMGYDDVSETPYEVVEFPIPMEFNEVYTRYNELLKTAGYDLSPYKGKLCKRYTYLIPSRNARANILVYEGEIIGGDISSITLDGIMIPIEKKID